MNQWPKPNDDPHENHPDFHFDENMNHPVLGGKFRLGKKPNPGDYAAGTAQRSLAELAVEISVRIDALNQILLNYKKGQATKEDYKDYAKLVDKFIKAGGPKQDGSTHAKPGSVAVEVVETGGFAVEFRLFGAPAHIHKEGREEVRFDHSSSSYYSVYPPDC